LYWAWDGTLRENEYYEVRIWHENMDYHRSLGWVREPPLFDYNLRDELSGKYYWSVVVVRDEHVRHKDWYKPEKWPYPVWEHDTDVGDHTQFVEIRGEESEIRYFFYRVLSSDGDPTVVIEP
jgi:hypothetical protein